MYGFKVKLGFVAAFSFSTAVCAKKTRHSERFQTPFNYQQSLRFSVDKTSFLERV